MQLIFSAVQGAADAFVAATLNTGINVAANGAYRIKEIMWEFPTLNAAASPNIEWALSRASKTSMPTLADDDILFKNKRVCYQQTGVGFQWLENVLIYTPQEDIILIEEQVFILLDSNATGLANTMVGRLTVEAAKVSTDERIAILQSRIN